MNWNQLKEHIDKMSLQQCLQEVRFVEPYDKQRAGYCLDFVYAAEDLTVDDEDQPEIVFVQTGEPFLR